MGVASAAPNSPYQSACSKWSTATFLLRVDEERGWSKQPTWQIHVQNSPYTPVSILSGENHTRFSRLTFFFGINLPPPPFQKGSGLMSQPKLSPANRTHAGRGRSSSRSANPQAAAFASSKKRPDENRGTGRQGRLGSPVSFCAGRRVLITAPTTGSTAILCNDSIEIAP
ncbi:hypothetical protein CH63R_09281 [Colletotrichum higginsianum IMI 349063]|uniref:Uncharacterized protein n=1 Tax=Colletotrichum higginsianum (strain IMI 349063) TaxID=759273 RepID=A0A1B7Y6U1_COLHI|nr:hypothetical protein CH63R_09281 [Colletotrichum higginsianum IMI 349063]OBR07760.1 hypothetical protein CH63R_09281 [Colletotrichum higginsianum IMI 349063]